ncbi:MAG: GNAT family N-acetyltransferase [Anaerolineales bacterium]|jgi:GNAT superfamily N-acetyltransferase|nr:GNAT family N-acetyltransferase [Anaerolineales bacterium]
MAKIDIRPAISTDIPKMISLDHNYATGHVWQMTLDLTDIQTQVSFREVRLPREVHVNYPRIPRRLLDDWTKRDLLLLAEEGGIVRGYISVRLGIAPASAWVEDLTVDRIYRRNGIASALVLAAQDWCGKKGIHRLTLEMQPKNYPAIQFAYKLGFEFSGYNDQYYRDQEIAIFFSSYI